MPKNPFCGNTCGIMTAYKQIQSILDNFEIIFLGALFGPRTAVPAVGRSGTCFRLSWSKLPSPGIYILHIYQTRANPGAALQTASLFIHQVTNCFPPTSIRRRHAQTVRDRSSNYKIEYVAVIKNVLYPKGHQNATSGSKVTALLLKGCLRLQPAQQACLSLVSVTYSRDNFYNVKAPNTSNVASLKAQNSCTTFTGLQYNTLILPAKSQLFKCLCFQQSRAKPGAALQTPP